MKQIVIATTNKGKFREMKDAFSEFDVEIVSIHDFGVLPEPIEDGETFEENAKKKATHYAKLTKQACIADDSGLEVTLLNNAPGVYSARYSGAHATDELNNEKLINEIKKLNKTSSPARYRCALAYTEGNNTLMTEGKCEGEIRLTAKGSNGFGYDPYFYVGDITMAEMSMEEKNKISHRGLALKEMIKELFQKGIIKRKK